MTFFLLLLFFLLAQLPIQAFLLYYTVQFSGRWWKQFRFGLSNASLFCSRFCRMQAKQFAAILRLLLFKVSWLQNVQKECICFAMFWWGLISCSYIVTGKFSLDSTFSAASKVKVLYMIKREIKQATKKKNQCSGKVRENSDRLKNRQQFTMFQGFLIEGSSKQMGF